MISTACPKLKKVHSSKELKNGLCCTHININGLYNKLDEIRLLLQESKFDLLAITETHLSEDIHKDTELCIDQYSFVSKDRTGKSNHWGGALVYYINFIEIEEIDMNTDIESIWINVILRSQKLLLGCIYRPPNDKKFLTSFKTALDNICHRSNVVLIGDFNIDLSNNCDKTLTGDFKELLGSDNLVSQIKDCTRITDSTITLINLVITCYPSKVLKGRTFSTDISDHDLIYIST